MNHYFKIILVCTALSGVLFLPSCKKDEPQLPDNLVAFESDQLGVASSETESTINLTLTRSASVATTVTVLIEPAGVTYGTDFTTDPAVVSSNISIPVASNATSASFKVLKTSGALFDGDETIKFTIQSAGTGLVLGDKKVLTLTFAEIVAASGSMELTGGGAAYPNKVFIDLSGNRQTAIARTTWDLGFSSTDDFRVILNSSNGMMVRALDKTDLTTVTAADTVGWGAQLSVSAVFAAITSDSPPAWVDSAIGWIDDPSGDLTKTAMASVSATASENKVYIVNRGTGPGTPAPQLGWKKIRIIRNGSNYTLQQADIGSNNITEVTITKDPLYRLNYVSFTTGAVTVEPEEAKWDIAWTGFTNSTNFGTGPVPYYFQDIILQNISEVQTVQVLTSAVTYETFAETNLTGLTFGTSQVNIGANWRSGGGPSSAPSIRTDRFYVIKDADGNYYKLRFTALTSNGERGKPQLEFALVKKGA